MEIERDYAYSVLEMNKRRFDEEKQTIENSYKYVILFHQLFHRAWYVEWYL